jgi:virulence-associated protein VagC
VGTRWRVLHSGRRRLRPAQKCGSARLGQGVDSSLDGDEPPIDVAAQDLGSVWYVRLKVPGTSRASRQRGGASEGALAISRHDRFPRSSAFNRIAPSAAMLVDETGSAAGILARHRRCGTHQNLNLAIRPHSEQAETEPSAKVAKPRVVFTPLRARRKSSSEPNFVACGSAIDPLQLEVEGQLKLADHDDRRIIAPQRQQIAASDLTFDNKAEPFEEGLDRPIEQRLQNCSPGLSQLEPSFGLLHLQFLKRHTAASSGAVATGVVLRTPPCSSDEVPHGDVRRAGQGFRPFCRAKSLSTLAAGVNGPNGATVKTQSA